MDWNIGWVFWIGCSYFLTIVNCYFVLVNRGVWDCIFLSCLAWRIANVFAMDWRWRSWNANPRSSKSSSSICHQIFNRGRHNSTVDNNRFTSHKKVLIQTADYTMELLPWKFYCIVQIKYKYIFLAKWLVCLHTDCLALYFARLLISIKPPRQFQPQVIHGLFLGLFGTAFCQVKVYRRAD